MSQFKRDTIERHCHTSPSVQGAVMYILFRFFFVFGDCIFVSIQDGVSSDPCVCFFTCIKIKTEGSRMQMTARANIEKTDDIAPGVVNASCIVLAFLNEKQQYEVFYSKCVDLKRKQDFYGASFSIDWIDRLDRLGRSIELVDWGDRSERSTRAIALSDCAPAFVLKQSRCQNWINQTKRFCFLLSRVGRPWNCFEVKLLCPWPTGNDNTPAMCAKRQICTLKEI